MTHYLKIESMIDFLMIRTPMSHKDLVNWINGLIHSGFSRNKIIIHSNIAVLEQCHLQAIHFSESDVRVNSFKHTHPIIQISMSTHHEQSIKQAQARHLDFILFSHIFKTNSKPDQPPRTKTEIDKALQHHIPIIALGGVNEQTLNYLPKGFDGIAGITIFRRKSIASIAVLRERWNEYQI
ncbi:thiamine phosphate synthase [Staphylococcus edaphicus]|nr:thiamine phosphate synthase [Staphylococcus edaphicus]